MSSRSEVLTAAIDDALKGHSPVSQAPSSGNVSMENVKNSGTLAISTHGSILLPSTPDTQRDQRPTCPRPTCQSRNCQTPQAYLETTQSAKDTQGHIIGPELYLEFMKGRQPRPTIEHWLWIPAGAFVLFSLWAPHPLVGWTNFGLAVTTIALWCIRVSSHPSRVHSWATDRIFYLRGWYCRDCGEKFIPENQETFSMER